MDRTGEPLQSSVKSWLSDWEIVVALLILLWLFSILSWTFDKIQSNPRAGALLSGNIGPLALACASALLSPLWPWSEPKIGLFGAGIALILAWSAATRDREIVSSAPETKGQRALVVSCALLGAVSPLFVFLACLLLLVVFRLTEHHASMPLRLLVAVLAYGIAEKVGSATSLVPMDPLASGLAWLLVIITVSHYWVAGLAKLFLGPRPWSWVQRNRLHYLAASAYSWGWARFVPWSTWLGLIRGVKRIEVPLQVAAIAIECLSPLALLGVEVAGAFFCGFALFHAGVFLLSGLLFWDWVFSNLFLVGLLHALAEERSLHFGAVALACGMALLVLFPLRQKLWKPLPLAWFDSPLTQRMVYSVVGESGQEYGLYNNFMCPHERLYGRVNGCFFGEDLYITYHLGEVWKMEIRDAIVDAGADQASLGRVKSAYGVRASCVELAERHRKYLAAYFCRLNRGAKKQILPRSIGFLKAPGDQIYYFGDQEPYQGQEPAREVRVRYREEYFDGHRLVRLADELRESIVVPMALDDEARVSELTPRELDLFLLGRAQGRLIDLPLSLLPESPAQGSSRRAPRRMISPEPAP